LTRVARRSILLFMRRRPIRFVVFVVGLCSMITIGLIIRLSHATTLSTFAAFADGLLVSDQDSSRPIAFLPHIPEGIDAIDLESGTLLWHSAAADRPLALWNSTLVGFKRTADSAITVVVLDPKHNGDILRQSESIQLPPLSMVTIENSPRFTAASSIKGDVISLHVWLKAEYRGGANPSAELAEENSRERKLRIDVNLKTGELVTVGDTDERVEPAAIRSDESAVVKDKRFEVVWAKAADDMSKISRLQKTLVAKDNRTGAVLWKSSLGTSDARATPKLPQ